MTDRVESAASFSIIPRHLLRMTQGSKFIVHYTPGSDDPQCAFHPEFAIRHDITWCRLHLVKLVTTQL